MPLKITLKPNEKILVGTAVIANGASKAELVILNRVPVLRQKDILTAEEADTLAKKLYYAVLNMYTSPDREKDFHEFYHLLMRKIIELPLGEEGLDLMQAITTDLVAGDHYRALKTCRKLIDYEKEIMNYGEQPADQRLPEDSEIGS